MTDINRRLQHNSTHQKQAKQAAEFLELDRQGKEIEERGQVRTFSVFKITSLICLLSVLFLFLSRIVAATNFDGC